MDSHPNRTYLVRLPGGVVGLAESEGVRHRRVHPGEVLVSSTERDLVAGSGITFGDRGLHVLEGVPGDWRIFAVT